jgi:hypothetical protein
MGIAFIDGVGNAYLKDRGLQIFVTGQMRRQGQEITGTRLPTGRASTPIGLKLVFALLSNPALTMATTQMLQETPDPAGSDRGFYGQRASRAGRS